MPPRKLGEDGQGGVAWSQAGRIAVGKPEAETLLARRCGANRHQRTVGRGRGHAARDGFLGQEPGGAAGGPAIGAHQHLVDTALRRACGCAAGLANDADRCRLTGRTRRTLHPGRSRRAGRPGLTHGTLRTRWPRIALRPRRSFAAACHACQHNNYSRHFDDAHGGSFLPIGPFVKLDNARTAFPLRMGQPWRGRHFQDCAVRGKRLDELAAAVPVSGAIDGEAAFATRRLKNRLNEKSTFADQAAGLSSRAASQCGHRDRGTGSFAAVTATKRFRVDGRVQRSGLP